MTKGYADFAIDLDNIVLAADPNAQVLREMLNDDIRWDMEPLLVGKQLLVENDELVGAAGITLTFEERSQYSDAEPFPEAGDVPSPDTSATMTGPQSSLIKVTPQKFGIGDTITEEAMDARKINVVRTHQRALARAMARRSDAMIWNRLFNVYTGTETVVGTGASQYTLTFGNGKPGNTGAPDFYPHDSVYIHAENSARSDVAPASLGVNVFIDAYTGEIEYDVALPGGQTGTFDYIVSDLPNRQNAITAGELSLQDIVKAKLPIQDAFGEPDTGVFNQNQLGDLQVDEQFTDVSKFGSREVILNGTVGRASGVDFLTSHRMYNGTGFICMKGEPLGVYVYKKRPTSDIDKIPYKSGDVFIKAWERSDVGILDRFMATVLVNMADWAKHL